MKKWIMPSVRVLVMLVGSLTLTAMVGCGTVDPAVVDAVTNAITNRPPPAVITNRPPPPPPVIVTNTPPPPPPVHTNDALDISRARTISKYVRNVPAMPVVTRLHSVNLSADRVTFNYDTVNWPSDGTIDGRIAIIWNDGGELIIGEFDGKRPNQKLKSLENIHGGYIQGKQPRPGDPVWFVIYDKKGTQRSSVAAGGTWKHAPPRSDGSTPKINTELLRP